MNDTIDLLQIKVENAKKSLPEETLQAIASVPWQAEILKMRERRGYSFEQLGDLEIETELLLCGLLSSADYPKELEKRMGIPKAQVDELVEELNEVVFRKIREELIKNIESKKMFGNKETKKEMPVAPETPTPPVERPTVQQQNNPPAEQIHPDEVATLKKAGIEITERKNTVPVLDLLELEPPAKIEKEIHPILAQKLSGYVQNEIKETEHSLDNISKKTETLPPPAPMKPTLKTQSYPPNADPYRLPPE